MDYPLGEFGSAGPTVLPPSLLSTPTLLTGWEQSKKLGKLWLCWTIATTLACYQHCFQSEIENTAPDRLLRAKLTPSQPHQYTTSCCKNNIQENMQSPYLHFDDCLQSLRLGWLRLKLGSSMQFLWRDTIEISLTTHLSIILIAHMSSLQQNRSLMKRSR